ncbi:CoA-disulfide reductase [Bacillus marinisedimentorum]|uniref:CoA-disulfide reductase n=1 Tax=Bacillus marinisedimentorum TaxID=1821260 RepID=UPI0007E2A593|nr:CoA-disulfide reductase [Bacillus marinisedimentorum]
MKVIIIGGDAGGMSAAMQIVRNQPDAEITVLEKGAHYSYAQCGLPYVVSGDIESTDNLVARKRETFVSKYGINATEYHEVTSVDTENKKVYGKQVKTGEDFEYEYDKLLIATGASPIVPKWEGIELDGIYPLKTIVDTHTVMENMDGVENVTIIGGGYIGLEMAESFVKLDKKVTIIEMAPQLGTTFDSDMAEYISEEAKRHNIEVKLSEKVTGFEGNGKVSKVKTDKGTYDSDLVLVSIGVRPNTRFLAETNIVLGPKGEIKVNAYMETNVKDVYAAGDCASQYHRIKEKDDHIPLGTNANKQGVIAGSNMSGVTKIFKGIVGSSVVKFMDLGLARTGLSEREAEDLGLPFASIKTDARDKAHYYPDSKPIHVKLIYNKDSRKLLGAQAIGENGAEKRIDVIATALFNEMSIEDLMDLDLTYAPPFNSVWDPVQQAARKAK